MKTDDSTHQHARLSARSALSLCVALVATCVASAGSPKRAADTGIAARYPGDVGIANDPRVVFVEDFETRTPGAFSSHWSSEGNRADALAIERVVPPGSRGGRSLKVTAKRGKNAGGYLFKVFKPGYDVLHARMYVRFAPGYGFSHHFCSLGGKLDPPKWPMGGAGLRPERGFSTGIEPACALLHTYPAKIYEPPGFWHFYTYWPEMRSWQTIEGRGDGRPTAYYGNNFTPRTPSVIERGKWICVEWAVGLNTDVAKRDGWQRFWIDGKLVGDWSPGRPLGYFNRETFRIRPDQGSKQKPFEGFRWRTDERIKINKFKIENYVSDRSWVHAEKHRPEHPEFEMHSDEWAVWFDHIVVATSYIGPVAVRAPRRESQKEATVGAPEVDGAAAARSVEANRLLQTARSAEAIGGADVARKLYTRIILEFSETGAAEKAFVAMERLGEDGTKDE